MNYYEKYIKYKNKYLNLKNNLGGAAEIEPIQAYRNSLGTCWFHIMLSIFTFGGLTKDEFTKFMDESDLREDYSLYEIIFIRIINNLEISNKLYEFMKKNKNFEKFDKEILDNKISLESYYIGNVRDLLFALLKRYENKKDKKNFNLEYDQVCEESLNENYNILFGRYRSHIGGNIQDRKNMLNLLSIIIYNRTSNIIFVTPGLINGSFIKQYENPNMYGIGLVIDGHIFSVFINNDVYCYSNNEVLKRLNIKIVTTNELTITNNFHMLLEKLNELNGEFPLKKYMLHLLNDEIILCINDRDFLGGAWNSTPPFLIRDREEAAEKRRLEKKNAIIKENEIKNQRIFDEYCKNLNDSNKITLIELYNFEG